MPNECEVKGEECTGVAEHQCYNCQRQTCSSCSDVREQGRICNICVEELATDIDLT
jgi:hypothetical protein